MHMESHVLDIDERDGGDPPDRLMLRRGVAAVAVVAALTSFISESPGPAPSFAGGWSADCNDPTRDPTLILYQRGADSRGVTTCRWGTSSCGCGARAAR